MTSAPACAANALPVIHTYLTGAGAAPDPVFAMHPLPACAPPPPTIYTFTFGGGPAS